MLGRISGVEMYYDAKAIRVGHGLVGDAVTANGDAFDIGDSIDVQVGEGTGEIAETPGVGVAEVPEASGLAVDVGWGDGCPFGTVIENGEEGDIGGGELGEFCGEVAVVQGVAQVGWSLGSRLDAAPAETYLAHDVEIAGPSVDRAGEFTDEGTGALILGSGHEKFAIYCTGSSSRRTSSPKYTTLI